MTVNGNRVLIKQRIKEITGKQLIMKDVHNLAAKLKRAKTSTVEGVCKIIDDQFPHYRYKLAVVGTEVRGIMLQSNQMRRDFDKYPELLFADSTYKLNDDDMPLYAMVAVDGNNRTRPVCVFIVTNETEATLSSMLGMFKEDNDAWTRTQVVLTDKDFTERSCFKQALPQISLQICLFHVKRNFGREVTTSKHNITSSEREEYLAYIERLVHSKSEDDYQRVLAEFFENCPSESVRLYYTSNWHHIRDQWVCGLVAKLRNFGHRTTNCVEQFFRTVKNLISERRDIQTFIHELLTCIDNIQHEYTHKQLFASITHPTTQETLPTGLSPNYISTLTPHAFRLLVVQMEMVDNVTIISHDTVLSAGQPIKPTESECPCDTSSRSGLPCRHMLALQIHNKKSTFLPHAIAIRNTSKIQTRGGQMSSLR